MPLERQRNILAPYIDTLHFVYKTRCPYSAFRVNALIFKEYTMLFRRNTHGLEKPVEWQARHAY